jgi:chloramphenicol 3-O phosphotransferase
MAEVPFLHVSLDDLLSMLPPRLLGDPDGIIFEYFEDGGRPCTAVKTGIVVDRALSGMRRAIAALAASGNNLIVDEVLWRGEVSEYRELLGEYGLRFVGLFAPLDVLEERERQRGDRHVGLARWQHDRVHRNISYDLELDANKFSAAERAEAICRAFDLERRV